MRTFVDTSALYALLDEGDQNHQEAAAWFRLAVADPAELLVSHSYVIVECTALVHRRLGVAATRTLLDGLIPALSVVYVDASLHERSTVAYLAAQSRRGSFVDRVSFQLIRDAGLDQAFAFDRDFTNEGFAVVPS